MAAADFNGDGKLDLAVANETTVSILLGNGDGTFGAPIAYSAGTILAISSMVVLDLSGDGAPDVAVSTINNGGSSYGVSVLLNKGGKLGQPIATSIPFNPSYLGFADLNHDGNFDMLVTGWTSNALTVLLGKGDGTFQAAASYPVGNIPTSLGIMQASDGSAMIFTVDDLTYATVITLVSSQGTIGTSRFYFVGGSPTGIAAADLNGDGFPDVVITGGSSDVSVVLSQGARQFKAPVGYSLGQNSPGPQAVAVGDLNGDGKPDVIVANGGNPFSSGPGSVSVLLNNGDGTLKPPTSTTVNQSAESIALGDFNRDGKLDVVVAAHGTPNGGSDPGAVVVLLGKGDGTFQPPVTLTVGGLHPSAVAAADLNNDGKLDLAVLMDTGTFGQPATLAIFLGQGNGAFAAARTFSLQSTTFLAPGGVTIGDLNGDGKPDIALISGGQQVEILFGDGAGGFQEAAVLPPTEFGPVALAMTDLDRDGKLDLVVAHCCGESDVTYLLGNGDGTFQPEEHIYSGASPTALALTHFSGTPGPDLVIVNQGGTWTPVAGIVAGNGATPSPISTGPGFGSASSQNFTFTFSDSSGYQNLSVVDVLINSALDGRRACYVAFVPSTATSGSVFLIDDAGDAGGPYQGMVLPGSGTVGNGQCTISGTGSSVNGSGNTLTLTLAITFSASFAGNKVVYTSAGDKSSLNSGWQALGTWGVPGAAPAGPWVSGMNPARTSSLGPTTYTFTFTDTNGWQDISVANILINSAIDGRHGCYLAVVPGSQQVLLVDDAGDAGGPYSGMVLPGNGTVSNSQCSITGTGSSINGSGNILTVTLAMTFSPSFAGNQLFFLAARSNTANSNWQAVGSVSVP